jgi:hypothetical protein
MDIDILDIKYTLSVKENNIHSYHFTIPSIKTTINNLKCFFKQEIYKEFCEYIDTSVYADNKYFRLPNQTNENKPFTHKIMHGEMKNFIINYVEESKSELENIEKIENIKKVKAVVKNDINDADILKQILDSPELLNTNCYIKQRYNIIMNNLNKFPLNNIETVENIPNELIENNEDIMQQNNETILNVELENIKYLFFKLNKKRINFYPLWFKLACLIKTLFKKSDGLELLLILSRESTKYITDEWIINKYNKEILKKNYTINTLLYWLKQDNAAEFQTYLIKRKIDKKLVDIIEINKNYLLELDDNLNKNTILNNKIDDFFKNDNIKSFNLKSPYDTGKTQLVKKIIDKYEPKRILWITYRQSLTSDIKCNFKQYNFESYMDGFYNADRQIIQLESLLKIGNSGGFIDEDIDIPTYDLVIIDEVEGILNHATNSVTFNNKNKEVFEFLEKIIECSSKLITMDGDTSNRTYNFINYFGKSINIVNNIKKNKKIFNFIKNETTYNNLIFDEINKNKKIVIVSQSKQKVEKLNIEIKKKYPHLKVLIYTSITGDEEKRKLEDVNNVWNKCDILLYSPTIEAGVNFDILHFDKIFGIITNNTSSQRAFMQMLARVRKTTDNVINILNTDFELNEVNEYFTFFDAMEASKEMDQFKLNKKFDIVNKTYKICYDNYYTNYLYNIVEEQNMNYFYFLPKLKLIMEEKGHEVNFINDENNETDDDESIEEFEDENKLNEYFEAIVKAPLLAFGDYARLKQKKKENNATKFEKLLITKQQLLNALCLEQLTYEDVKNWYYSIYKLKNYSFLKDINSFKRTDEIKNEIQFEKLNLIKDVINNFGFVDITDEKKCISNDELIEKFKYIYKNNKIYTCSKSSKTFMGTKYLKLTDTTTTREILGNLNAILDNFSVKISQKRLRENGSRKNYYYLETLNNVEEILIRKAKKLAENNF